MANVIMSGYGKAAAHWAAIWATKGKLLLTDQNGQDVAWARHTQQNMQSQKEYIVELENKIFGNEKLREDAKAAYERRQNPSYSKEDGALMTQPPAPEDLINVDNQKTILARRTSSAKAAAGR